MRLDNGAADRQAETDTILFGCVKSVKDSIVTAWREAFATIDH
jgi:hypothetical protein